MSINSSPELPNRTSRSQIKPRFLSLAQSTQRLVRSFGEILQLATLLAFVAGIVNSSAFLEFGTFVSHISGHATRAAVDFTDGRQKKENKR